MSFDQLGLTPELLRAVAQQGYTEPTPVQREAIPHVLNSRDLLAGAQTGTGKTAAFVLPILQRLNATHREGPRKIRVLVLTPTRELALQVEESFRTYGKQRPVVSAAIYGGVGFDGQVRRLRQGPEVVVATPGRLLDHVNQRTINLSQVEVLVLDEADRMLDMGFIHDIRKVLELLPRTRQNLLFSATFNPEIRRLANEFLNDPAYIQATPKNTAAELVKQVVIPVDRSKKRELLSQLVKSGRIYQALVFTRTKHGADRLVQQLTLDGISASAIHGNKSQPQRVRALNDFKNNKVAILVATEVAARGLDIDALPHVVNYEMPMVAADYVHRIGRTGRAGTDGDAISLVCVDERPLLAEIEHLLGYRIDQEIVPGFEPDPNIRPQAIQLRSADHQARFGGNRPNGQRPARRPDSNFAQRGEGRRYPDHRSGRPAQGSNRSNWAPQGCESGSPRFSRSPVRPARRAPDPLLLGAQSPAWMPEADTPSERAGPHRLRQGNLLLGNIRDVGRDPLAFLTTTARDHGDVVRYRLATYDFYLVTHPDGVQRILLDNNRNYTRTGTVIWNALRPAFGDPLVGSDGESWLFRRRIMQPVFVHRQVARFAELMVEQTASLLDEWDRVADTGEPVDIVPYVGRLTLKILMEALFGVQNSEVTGQIGQATLVQSRYAIMRAQFLFYPPPIVPTPHNRRLRAAKSVLDRNIYSLIDEHRAHPDQHSDLLALLIQARDEKTGEALRDKQLCDEVASFYFAGFSSSSNALLWAFYLLAQHPEVMHRLLADIDEVLGDRPPTAFDLPNLPYVQQIVMETIRLYPPIYVSVRKVLADDEILGYRIPSGSHVTISSHVTHRSPHFWDEPERFDPDRFEPERAKSRPRYAYFPFLGGPHQCLGRDFFLLEAQLVLIMVAQRYRLELVPGHVAEPEALITQRMRGSLPMFIRHRQAPA